MESRREGTMLELGCELPEEDKKRRDTLLILAHQLCDVQISIHDEIENIYNRQGKFKYTIKHNHRQIKAMMLKNYPNWFGNKVPEDPKEQEFYFKRMEAYTNDVEAILKALGKLKHINLEDL